MLKTALRRPECIASNFSIKVSVVVQVSELYNSTVSTVARKSIERSASDRDGEFQKFLAIICAPRKSSSLVQILFSVRD